MLKRYRAIFISDLHLGTKRAQAKALLDFLRSTDSDTLYLVGDVIDIWALRRKWFWTQDHNDVIQKLLRKARRGTRVIYVPGNHDEYCRDFCDHHFGNLEVALDTVHVTAAGKRYLVLHGDKFDHVVCVAPWVAKLGDAAYELAMDLNLLVTRVRRWLGLPYWSLSANLKQRVKRAVEFISNYETAVVRDARHRSCSGVICGHIHAAGDREIDGIHYLNTGDWVESCTALVEHMDGRFEIIHWQDAAGSTHAQPATALAEFELPAMTASASSL
jgi:UDP-2,3-diacylglucosamine pyrophosphatase LpxH